MDKLHSIFNQSPVKVQNPIIANTHSMYMNWLVHRWSGIMTLKCITQDHNMLLIVVVEPITFVCPMRHPLSHTITKLCFVYTDNAKESEMDLFQREINLVKNFKPHPNILGLVSFDLQLGKYISFPARGKAHVYINSICNKNLLHRKRPYFQNLLFVLVGIKRVFCA